MLKLKPSDTTVPDGFTYRFPQDGHVVRHNVREAWFAAIDKHYKDNSYPQPENWREIAEDALCRRLSGEWCTGGTPHSFVNTRFTLDAFIRGTKVLSSFVLGGGKVVSQEQANARAIICSRCPANSNIAGCSSCHGIANMVADAKGAKTTPYDHMLAACAVCACSNAAAVWIPIEHLAKGITPEMRETYETFDECWRAKELLDSEKLS